MEATFHTSCEKILNESEKIRQHSDYRNQPNGARIRYEKYLSECEINERNPESALALAAEWNGGDEADRFEIEAKAHAKRQEDEKAREALERFAAAKGDLQVLLEEPLFRRYRGQDWFVSLGFSLRSESNVPLERTIRGLTGKPPLSFSLAWADRHHPAGDWVIWSGKITDARIDRERNRTILTIDAATHVDIQTEHIELNRVDISRNALTGSATVTPHYTTQTQNDRVLELSGREFVVEFKGVSERIVELSYVRVLGKYDGHDGQHPTVLGREIFSLTLRLK